MTDKELEKLRYPIGKYKSPEQITKEIIVQWISIIEAHPVQLRNLVSSLSDEQLDTPYRPGGWTIRQVVHHLPDSHLNSYIRLKWTLTEDKPKIKPYYEDRWAELADSFGPIDGALDLLQAVHKKWVGLLKTLSEKDLKRSFIHPETNSEISLDKNIGLYAWHCQHHFAHIENLLKQKGW